MGDQGVGSRRCLLCFSREHHVLQSVFSMCIFAPSPTVEMRLIGSFPAIHTPTQSRTRVTRIVRGNADRIVDVPFLAPYGLLYLVQLSHVTGTLKCPGNREACGILPVCSLRPCPPFASTALVMQFACYDCTILAPLLSGQLLSQFSFFCYLL